MRVIVCGGRDYEDREVLFHEMHLLAEQHGWLTVIEGGARGADAFAREWAKLCYHGLVTFEADWQAHGTAAGPIRNAQMLVSGKPDLVLAFPSPRRGLVNPLTGRNTGTGDMVQKARAADVEVRVIGLEKKGLFE